MNKKNADRISMAVSWWIVQSIDVLATDFIEILLRHHYCNVVSRDGILIETIFKFNSYFHSIMSYGMLLWGNPADIEAIYFVLQKQFISTLTL